MASSKRKPPQKNKSNNIKTEVPASVVHHIKRHLKALPKRIRTLPGAFRQNWRSDKLKKKYRSFRLQKRIKPEPRAIPSTGYLFKQSFTFMWRWRTVFLAMMVIHAVIYFVLVQGPVPENGIETIRESVETILGQGANSTLRGNLTTLGAVLSTSENNGQNSILASFIIILLSLVYIWGIRQLSNNKKIAARDAYYQGPTTLLPALLVLCVISLQLLPFAIASFIYSVAKNGQIFVSGAEDLSFFLVTFLVGLLSFYWVTSSVIALYIVTLPGMYPMQALKAAKKLVQFRRLAVFRRILALPIVLGLLYFTSLLLIIRFMPNQTYLALAVFQVILLPFIHVYLYKLYRALI
jgi:hypothetical protein